MRVFLKVIVLCLGCVCSAFPRTPHRDYNTIERYITDSGTSRSSTDETKALKKVFLSNRSVTCNDGSQAGFYLRKSHSSKKWIIFLEGGWYCYDHHTCKNRWIHQRHYMTSSQWPEVRDVGGILSPNEEENPYWWNVNHVFVPYCSSDSWSGSRSASPSEMFSFLGAAIVQQVVRDLVPLGLENSTDLLLTGSSAGGTGAMLNLDPVQELLHEVLGLRHIAVRGVCDSGWFLDRTPYIATGEPAVDAIRNGMQLWQGKVPKSCRQMYIDEPWRCYYGYRLYPTLKAPLFVFQWLFDEAQMDADNVGAPVSKQQWDYIHKMGEALRQSFENVSAVFAPSCISHSVLTKRDWIHVKVNDVSIDQAIHCWEQSPLFPPVATGKGGNKGLRRRGQGGGATGGSMLGDEPPFPRKHFKKLGRNRGTHVNNNRRNNNSSMSNDRPKGNSERGSDIDGSTEQPENKRRRRKKHKNKRKNKKRKERRGQNGANRNRANHNSTTSTAEDKMRAQRSLLRLQQKQHQANCQTKNMERCSWPQCNGSCPKLHNPFTGEEMDLLELLQSFGVDMEGVALALGIDLTTLNNMDHSELLNLLTQGKVKEN